MNTARPAEIADRLAAVRARIDQAGGADVTLIAVAKTFPFSDIVAARAAGQVDFGESYAQELVAKVGEQTDTTADPQDGAAEIGDLRWHFVGGVQRNKVRLLAGSVALWHSVDRASLIDEIARRDAGAAILVQVNTAQAAQQGGCAIGEVEPLVQRASDAGLDVRGLMTIAPQGDQRVVADAFTTLRSKADNLGLRECSMGMSGDLELAVQQGATMVRIGRDIFGDRPRI